MKNKYDRMSKEEKKDLYIKYKQEKSVFVKKLEKMFLLCYIGIIYGLLMFIYDLFFKKSTFSYLLDVVVFIFCFIALLRLIYLKRDLLNKFAINKDKEKKKEIVKKYKK